MILFSSLLADCTSSFIISCSDALTLLTSFADASFWGAFLDPCTPYPIATTNSTKRHVTIHANFRRIERSVRTMVNESSNSNDSMLVLLKALPSYSTSAAGIVRYFGGILFMYDDIMVEHNRQRQHRQDHRPQSSELLGWVCVSNTSILVC